MLNHTSDKHHISDKHVVASDFIGINNSPLPPDKKTRERLAVQRRMAARRAIEQRSEKRELELHSKEYWFDG